MAGSLAHILANDGTFRGLDLIDSEGDKWAALAECHQIIAVLLPEVAAERETRREPGGPWTPEATLKQVCDSLGYPVPTVEDASLTDPTLADIVVPLIQPELHGCESVYRPQAPQPKDHLIWSNEHQAWWRPNRAGYTGLVEEAGRYTKAEADRICAEANRPGNVFKWGSKINEMAIKAPEGL